jgi:hypothetical protein
MVGGEKRIVEGLSHGMFYVLRNCDRDDEFTIYPSFVLERARHSSL